MRFCANAVGTTMAARRRTGIRSRFMMVRNLSRAVRRCFSTFRRQLSPPPPAGLPDLVGALKATPGVLGVDAGQMASGKQVIFAWFENKRAVLNWYNSDVHRQLMNGFSSGARRPDGPLAGIKDDSGPI